MNHILLKNQWFLVCTVIGVLVLIWSNTGFSQFISYPVIGSDQTVCPNTLPDTLRLILPAHGGVPPYRYQWQVSTDG